MKCIYKGTAGFAVKPKDAIGYVAYNNQLVR